VTAAPIRALVVDDEPLARRKIRRLLRGVPDVVVAGECGDGAAAAAMLRDVAPDLVFLDVQMPGLDGFAVLDALPAGRAPAVVFTTAYDEYAARAFEVRALDYLVKPFSRARFDEALRRAREALARAGGGAGGAVPDPRLAALLEELRAERARPERLVVKEDGRVRLVAVDDVDRVEAAGNYVRVHAGGASHLVRESMAALEPRLDPRRFVRVHRSTIVNVARIREIQPWFRGDLVLILRDGARVTLSRTYRERLRAVLGPTL
jgi:two-component system, LytTR family, response regulator